MNTDDRLIGFAVLLCCVGVILLSISGYMTSQRIKALEAQVEKITKHLEVEQ